MRNTLLTAIFFFLTGTFSTSYCTTFETNIPDIGQEPSGIIDANTEKTMGHVLLQKLRVSEKLTEDLLVNQYLSELGDKISSHANIQHFKLHFFWYRQ